MANAATRGSSARVRSGGKRPVKVFLSGLHSKAVRRETAAAQPDPDYRLVIIDLNAKMAMEEVPFRIAHTALAQFEGDWRSAAEYLEGKRPWEKIGTPAGDAEKKVLEFCARLVRFYGAAR